MIRCYIVHLIIFLTICSVSWAGENYSKTYLIVEEGTKEGVILDVNDKKYHVKEVKLDDFIKSCRIISQDNSNNRYWINLKPNTMPEKDFHGLILKVKDFTIVSSGHGASGELLDSISLYADSKISAEVAREFNVSLEKRKHPGHILQTEFIFEQTNKNNVVLKITNLGNNTLIFQDGGMNRGMRNNQFNFVGFRNNKQLIDLGSPVHFGGRSTYVTLRKDETFEKKIDLTKWFDLSENGFYEIIGTYYLEFHNSIKEHRIQWSDFVGAQFTFTRD